MNKQEKASRLGSVIWMVSLLKRHYFSYVLMVIAALIGAFAVHKLYPHFHTYATIYINSADDSQLLNRLGKISGHYVNPYKEKDDADKYLKLFEAQAFTEFVANKIQEESSKAGKTEFNTEVFFQKAEDLLSVIIFKKVDSESITVNGVSNAPKDILSIVRRVALYAKEAIIDHELTEIENSEKYLKSEMLKSKERLSQLSAQAESFKNSKKNLQFSLSDKISPLKASIARLREELEVTKVQITKNKILENQFSEQLKKLNTRQKGVYHPGDLLASRGRLVDMIQAVQQEMEALDANKDALQKRLNKLQSDLSPGYEQKVYEFQKQIELEYSFYELLQENLFQSGIQSISVKNRVRSVDLPSIKNVTQKLPFPYKAFFAILLATLTTIIIVALVEYFYPVVIGKKEIMNLGFYYLSHIPKLNFGTSMLSPKKWISKGKDMVVQVCADHPESQGGTAFRYLRVRFLQSIAKAKRLQKVIAIGSSRPNEGKSFVSVNFAISLSSVGRKVLLVDADERVASISKILSDLTGDGLIQYCKGQASLNEVIAKEVYSNMDVLPVGYHTDNETIDVLSSGKLKEICEKLYDDYDHIIIDTPAFHAGADALLVYEIADKPIIVLEANKTSLAEAHNILDILKTIGHRSVFAVLNRYTEIFEVRPQNYYYALPRRKEDAA
ncbi:MAG: AAA family ATPase [Bdellovibrionales bacterium]|nr:AAA family ATPase [Bdellovibrionales bacterium]